jgi:hypothetical protein
MQIHSKMVIRYRFLNMEGDILLSLTMNTTLNNIDYNSLED